VLEGHLTKNEKLAAQAPNHSEERFAMGDFQDAFTEIFIEARDAHNIIADQFLKDERIVGVMQKMVWEQFQAPSRPTA
jgi:type I restriction enzyme R subunit